MPNPAPTEDRRQFSRVPFDTEVRITDGLQERTGRLLDVSLKGVLVALQPDWEPPAEGHLLTLELRLAQDQAAIRMEVRVAHRNSEKVGFSWEHIDLDSMARLRRLLDLNLGDPAALSRELSELGQP